MSRAKLGRWNQICSFPKLLAMLRTPPNDVRLLRPIVLQDRFGFTFAWETLLKNTASKAPSHLARNASCSSDSAVVQEVLRNMFVAHTFVVLSGI